MWPELWTKVVTLRLSAIFKVCAIKLTLPLFLTHSYLQGIQPKTTGDYCTWLTTNDSARAPSESPGNDSNRQDLQLLSWLNSVHRQAIAFVWHSDGQRTVDWRTGWCSTKQHYWVGRWEWWGRARWGKMSGSFSWREGCLCVWLCEREVGVEEERVRAWFKRGGDLGL